MDGWMDGGWISLVSADEEMPHVSSVLKPGSSCMNHVSCEEVVAERLDLTCVLTWPDSSNAFYFLTCVLCVGFCRIIGYLCSSNIWWALGCWQCTSQVSRENLVPDGSSGTNSAYMPTAPAFTSKCNSSQYVSSVPSYANQTLISLKKL